MKYYKEKTYREMFPTCLNVYVFYLMLISVLMHNTSKAAGSFHQANSYRAHIVY